ncbi:hypothetical protein ACHAPJ_002002 [Fusarium lateritium]
MWDELDECSTDDIDNLAHMNSVVRRDCYRESKSLEARDTGLGIGLHAPETGIRFGIPDHIIDDYIFRYLLPGLGPQTLDHLGDSFPQSQASETYNDESEHYKDESEPHNDESETPRDDDWETYDKKAICECGGNYCHCEEVSLDVHDDESHTADDGLDRSENVCRCVKEGDMQYCKCDHPIEGLDTGDEVGSSEAKDEKAEDEKVEDKKVEDKKAEDKKAEDEEDEEDEDEEDEDEESDDEEEEDDD